MSGVRCESDGCHNTAAVHVLHPRARVCENCADEMTERRFPRAKLTLDAITVAGVFRNAAIELEELAGAAPAYEIGTLRRKMRAVIVGALMFAEGFS